jgi:putative hemolysin
MITFVAAILVSLFATCLCSMAEACLLSLSLTDVATIAEKRPKVGAILKRFKDNIQKPIAVVLIVNTFAQTMGAAVSGGQFHELFGPKWIGLYSLAFSLVMIQWGEILPKTLGVRHNRFVGTLSAKPMDFAVKLLNPLVFLIQLMNRPFEGRKHRVEASALHDISVLAHFAAIHNMISSEQEAIVARSIALSQKTVADVMVSREEMRTLDTGMSLSDGLVQAHAHHHTRFPLVAAGTDEIVGYVNFKDILNALRLNPEDPSLKGICRPITSVAPTEKLTGLLNQLIKSYQHIALVKDATGAVKGMVTLEDVIESIVGEINDEYDILPSFCYPLAEKRYVAGGGVKLSELRQKVDPEIPDISATLNDWLLQQFGRSVNAEDQRSIGSLTYMVRKISRAKIIEVVITKS